MSTNRITICIELQKTLLLDSINALIQVVSVKQNCQEEPHFFGFLGLKNLALILFTVPISQEELTLHCLKKPKQSPSEIFLKFLSTTKIFWIKMNS